ncbi:MAG: ribbon-helix-helix protein, CopG family [Flavobacteriales bacterium]|nr:ribbon-helix-helix protein, CopG family [Flavobacteriales bacterium]
MVGVRLPEDLEKRLDNLAAMTHRPKSYYLKESLKLYLDEFEDIYSAITEYEQQKKDGTLVTYTMDELEKRHGL